MSREAMKLALEALENWLEFDPENFGEVDNKAITALQEALAEQPAQQEPVAYGMWDTMLGKGNRMMMVRLDKGQDGCTVPLYTSPPAQRTWVGLSEGEKKQIANLDFLYGVEWAEVKLKEKNA